MIGKGSAVDDADGSPQIFNNDVETEVKELMGLFDLPAFARRGQDVEFVVRKTHERCRRVRGELLDMVHLRLKQWSQAVTGPGAWAGVFTQPIDPLWPLTHATPPQWSATSAPPRRQLAIARDLIAATARFNRRFSEFIEALNLEPTNTVIDHYNRYYVLEKECVMGSARLAARHFQPVPRITPATLLADYPLLPVPQLAAGADRRLK
jgi:hypothetical protein